MSPLGSTAPNKGTNSDEYPKKAPFLNKSSLGSPLKGKFNLNNDKNKLFVEGFQNGLVLVYVQKAQKREEAFLAPDFDLIKNSEEIAESLSVNEILQRKGNDGKTPMPQKTGSAYPWRALTSLVGAEFQNAVTRRDFANGLVEFFNSHATTKYYKYPKMTKFAGDLTKTPLQPVNEALLDIAVIELIQMAYPDATLPEIIQHDDTMKTFWLDITHGKIAMNEYATMHGDISDGVKDEESDSASE
jgi:hypothetical protein